MRIIEVKYLLSFCRNDSGATAIEYGLIVSLIVIGAAGALGTKLKVTFNHVAANLS